MISVAVVEDNAGVRRSLELLLNESPGFRCTCACDSAEDALRLIPRDPPKVVLMDIHLPDISGIECTAQLKQRLPAVQIVMLTVYTDTDKVFKALRAGASGYLLKRAAPEEILGAIAEVEQGGAPMTGEIARRVIETFQEPPEAAAEGPALTRREQEVLELLCQGLSNKEIAQTLFLGSDGVRYHLKQIYEKLHVHSRAQAMARMLSARQSAGGQSLAAPHHPAFQSHAKSRPGGG